ARIVLERVVGGAPLLDDALAFRGERRLGREAFAAARVGLPDTLDRPLRRGRCERRREQRRRQDRPRGGAPHRPNSVPSANRIDHMYISALPVALGLPMHVTRSPTLMRSKSQPRRRRRFTLLNSMSQSVAVPSSADTRSRMTECGLRMSTCSISPLLANAVTLVSNATGA